MSGLTPMQRGTETRLLQVSAADAFIAYKHFLPARYANGSEKRIRPCVHTAALIPLVGQPRGSRCRRSFYAECILIGLNAVTR